MIQFNLLPDIKIEYIRAQRNKRLVVAVSSLVTVVALAIVIGLSLSVFVFQKEHMANLSDDIAKSTRNLGATNDISKILTVQNQLNSLSGLHDKKQNTTRIFPYIQQLTPTDISISSFTIDFELQTMTVTGAANDASANKLAAINRFVDTLKFTEYTSGEDSSKAFSEVVLSSIGRAESGASYTIALKFDPQIFSNTENVALNVPKQITTRSETEKPTSLFDAANGGRQ